jgi:hypothetical protein
MPNLSTDALFILVKSLEKGEKRNFKLYAARNSASADLKIVQLFDALDKMKEKARVHSKTTTLQFKSTFIRSNFIEPAHCKTK